MTITSFTSNSFDGQLVRVEVDIRRGIPGMDIIGLPDSAVLESRERLRAALRNSGFEVPKGRILINLAPAGIRKEGASFDLAIAAAVLHSSGAVETVPEGSVMIVGELMLSGEIRPVSGVLSAVSAAAEASIEMIIVPEKNRAEAESLGRGRVYGISNIQNLPVILASIVHGNTDAIMPAAAAVTTLENEEHSLYEPDIDFADIRGLHFVKRALVVAAAGRHNALLFGPPGGGKTICCRALSGILPALSRAESIETTRIYSAAGMLPEGEGLIRRPPFREPHHSASEEGIIGGGKAVRPGEVSLAHNGVLFLDETPEFSKNILQSLREPVEERRIDIARAGKSCIYPADFQLLLAANPCPCGNLGRKEAVCICSRKEIMSYWKKLGGALLDRIDIRIPVKPETVDVFRRDDAESSMVLKDKVAAAAKLQAERFRGENFRHNSRIPQGKLKTYCEMAAGAEEAYTAAVTKLRISSRACVSVLKTARTIADLRSAANGKSDHIRKEDVFEAIQHRRYGEQDFYWSKV